MANPTPYERGYSFSGFQANSPKTPLPGPKVDAELDNLEKTTAETISALADIRRSDGKLQNGIVTADALSPEVTTGISPALPWTTATRYRAGATVFFDTAFYRATSEHVSSANFSTDLGAGRWIEVADLGPIADQAAASRDEAVAAADTATTQAGIATTGAATATTQAGVATTGAATATTQAGVATTQAGIATTKAGEAAASAAAAAATAATVINGFQTRVRYSAADGNLTNGQTVFTVPGGYDPNEAEVQRNGLTLVNGVDVTVTSGTTFTLATGVGPSDIVVFKAFGVFNANSKSDTPTAIAGTNDTKFLTPKTGKESIAVNAEYADFTPNGTGAVVRPVRLKLRDLVNAKDGGIVVSTADQTAKLQTFLNNFSSDGGGRLDINADLRIRLDGSISIPSNVTVEGASSNMGGQPSANILAQGPQFNLASTATITVPNSGVLKKMAIFRQGLAMNITSAQVASTFAGTAVTLALDSADHILEDLLILGFNTAIRTAAGTVYTQRPRIRSVNIDCINGIFLENIYDIPYIEGVHCWPWVTVASTNETNFAQLIRSGSAIKLSGVNDWSKLYNCFNYGYSRGYEVTDADNVLMIGCGADHRPGSLVDGSIGFLIQGDAKKTQLIGCQTAAKENGYYFNTADANDPTISMVGCSAWETKSNAAVLERGALIASGCMMRNTATAGNGFTVLSTATSGRFYNNDIRGFAQGIVSTGSADVRQSGNYFANNTADTAGVTDVGEWVAFTPTVTAEAGTFTTVSSAGSRCRRVGNTVQYSYTIAITNNGTADGAIRVPLPYTSASVASAAGREIAAVGTYFGGSIGVGATFLELRKFDNAYPGATGYTLIISGTYEAVP